MEIVEHDRLDGGAEEVKKEVKHPEEVKKVVPAVVGGQPGGWQIVIKASPESLPHEWLAAVQDATRTCLSVAASPTDVMDIFRKNKQVFDAVKAQDPVFFKQLMNDFSVTKQKFEVQA